jgi:hypothetical protein
MSDAVIFVGVFGTIFVLRIIAATVAFYFILPRGDQCPNCDAVTIRVQRPIWNRLFPFLRTSWCYNCGWEGMLRHGPLSSPPQPAPPQLTNHGQEQQP